ncbi:MAG: hypothetical protein WCF30_00590 [Terracidiphilus sp.]
MARGILLTLALSLALTNSAFAKAKHDFQTGKLLNVTADERYVEGTSIRSAIFIVQIGDLVYTARGERIRRNTGDIGQGLIIGDPVQVAIDGEKLIILKPDGKELSVKIVKRERAQ